MSSVDLDVLAGTSSVLAGTSCSSPEIRGLARRVGDRRTRSRAVERIMV